MENIRLCVLEMMERSPVCTFSQICWVGLRGTVPECPPVLQNSAGILCRGLLQFVFSFSKKKKKKKTAEFLPSPFQRDSVRKRGPELPCPTPLPFPWQNREWDRADFYSPWEPLAPFAELVQWHMMTGIIVFHTPAILAHNWLFISNPRS